MTFTITWHDVLVVAKYVGVFGAGALTATLVIGGAISNSIGRALGWR